MPKFIRPSFWDKKVTQVARVIRRRGVASLDFASIAAAGNATLTMTVTGAKLGHGVQLRIASPQAGFTYEGWVSATDTVSVKATNTTGGGIDAPATSVVALAFEVV